MLSSQYLTGRFHNIVDIRLQLVGTGQVLEVQPSSQSNSH